jgi:riboflavin kinase/FMN adenylyltransferase
LPADQSTGTMAFQHFLDPDGLPEALAGATLAIGNFDGVHRGHRAVIEAAEALAKGRPAVALTFEPHPRSLFRPEPPIFRLTPGPVKLKLLERAGLAAAITLTFDRDFANRSAENFLEELVVKRLKAHAVAVGYDFHFGKDRRGTPEFLVHHGRSLGLDIAIVAPLAEAGEPISSSAIRQALCEGDIPRANRLLGHEWSVVGTVIHGEKRGRDLGYPTANIRLEPGCGLSFGIYAVRMRVDGVLRDGVASFGRRPTFDNGAPLLEVYVFDFTGDLYGREVEVFFVERIRGEEKFDSLDALVARMRQDEAEARAILAARPAPGGV